MPKFKIFLDSRALITGDKAYNDYVFEDLLEVAQSSTFEKEKLRTASASLAHLLISLLSQNH